jgi:hypothetical protein
MKIAHPEMRNGFKGIAVVSYIGLFGLGVIGKDTHSLILFSIISLWSMLWVIALGQETE